MKKILALLAIVVLAIGGCSMMKNEPTKEEMIEVLQSREAIDAIEEAMRNREKNALTNSAVIKEYIIDYNSLIWSPMGGIKLSIIVNNDSSLVLYYTLNKHNGKYKVGGSHASNELDSLLESVYGK
ncbi:MULTISPECIES: DUF1310 family protein [unclassified Granulicatella]|uniref:DUF1310 family protein n=1 Tax=unclassified Granulicatella TaxID=2630493 RepID=UPI00142FFA44|nr:MULTISPECIES: DUF1310 family protein [unclassified Granulicatella]MBF0780364.1 DUF1310 family protein [Granulicatella sp. 19428wC4_WM01]